MIDWYALIKGIATGICLATVAIGGWGCSSGPSAAEFSDRYASELCDYMFRCCSPSERLSLNGNATDPVHCAVDYRDLLNKIAMETGEGLTTYFYSSENAQRCLDAIKAAACSGNVRLTPACVDVYAGQSPVGGICFDGSWCRKGLECSFAGSDSDAGKCVQLPRLGETCSGGCSLGLFCDSSGVCVEGKDVGASCAENVECATYHCGPEVTPGAGLTCVAPPVICTGA